MQKIGIPVNFDRKLIALGSRKCGENAKILGDILHGKIGVSSVDCFEKSNLGIPC
jgi:hypothetical protein